MKRILIVKVTSLSDIIEAQPVVADIKRAFPGVKVDWAADEMFADVARWNAGIDRVLCAPLRRFKKARSLADFRSIAASIAELRAERYDVVIDIHGVYKSAIIAFLARSSRRLGYRSQDLGERGAAFAYTGRLAPRPDVNAWHGMRISVGDALGFQVEGPPVFNLQVPGASSSPVPTIGGAPVAMLFHATSKDEKKLPATHWAAIARNLIERGYAIELPWGSPAERIEAGAIAALVPEASLLPPMDVTEIARMIVRAALVVGVDTGFVHLAHALRKRTVMIFVTTSPEHSGVEAPFRSISVGDGQGVPPVDEVLRGIDYVQIKPDAAGDATVAIA
ncbi:MAG: lipopolysaccharide heptosyltransferase I [Paraburkholderia sp.]|uniref:lipopolysaccharide heptosyltransferase I n=1 Tax=Paraburkholderia sp. TaxID=1926495 RepID=UPI00120A4F86|nr:lipopolysaccharide heptosyltransferase I [Paraburkholderia sp.]TAL96317.1 MAG: lipopolysaccharide heptosyltransferase I [Paraburkholderia sp.]